MGALATDTVEDAVLTLTNEYKFYEWVCERWAPQLRDANGDFNRPFRALERERSQYIIWGPAARRRYGGPTVATTLLAAHLIYHYQEELDLPNPPPYWVQLYKEHTQREGEVSEPTKEPTQEEPTMNKLFEVKHYISGHESGTIDNDAIYAAIAEYEARIAKLEAVKTKPKRLKDDIAAMQGEIEELVKFLDGKE